MKIAITIVKLFLILMSGTGDYANEGSIDMNVLFVFSLACMKLALGLDSHRAAYQTKLGKCCRGERGYLYRVASSLRR